MKTKNKIPALILVMVVLSSIATSCHKGVGCPADQYNDWKKIEAARKQQTKSPGNPNKGKNSKTKTVGSGIVP